MTRDPFFILVGVDGTLPSLHALRYALRLCAQAGPNARLHLCHVMPVLDPGRASVLPAPPATVGDGCLVEALAEARAAAVEPTFELVRGDPSTVLAERADSLGADLLVIGSARRAAAIDALRGTVGVESLAACPCPVVLAR